jgi:uncharacterized protein
MNPVCYFEIPVLDIERASAFYSAVFEVSLERTEIDGNVMALFPSETDGAGASGSLAMGDSYRPSPDGPRLYFFVDEIDEVLARAVAHGGSIAYPKTSIGELGHVAEFLDCEGNTIALSSD